MVLVCFGTRPEIIKLTPVIEELKSRGIRFKTAFTGQHKDMYLQFKNTIPTPDYWLDVMRLRSSLGDTISSILLKLDQILGKGETKFLIVQGDTSSSFACALSAFNNKVPIGHVEAGLRTNDLTTPFPEEGYRQMISRIATLHWAPTEKAMRNLQHEGIQNARLTGNTVIDACNIKNYEISYGNKVLIVLNRRENYGDRMKKLFTEIEELANRHPELEIIFPMNNNPNVKSHKYIFKKVNVIEPLEYAEMLKLISEAKFVISDSGGLQEECAAFRKKILICRENTERPEGLEVGVGKLVNTEILSNYHWAYDHPQWNGLNPFGDGNARIAIVDHLQEYLQL
ncbi:MAG: UDP-N-acetylglucosamine 2-epimerase (non-hydrolyzing) [Saprospiraceae bacterium]